MTRTIPYLCFCLFLGCSLVEEEGQTEQEEEIYFFHEVSDLTAGPAEESVKEVAKAASLQTRPVEPEEYPELDLSLDFPYSVPPGPGAIIVNELMIDPKAVSDTSGEYIELKNVTLERVDLAGLVVKDAGKDSFSIDRQLLVEPAGLVVLARKGNPKENGGLVPNHVYGGRMSLSNGEDEVILEYNGVIVDQVGYSKGVWGIPAGASLELDFIVAAACINDLSDVWCKSKGKLPHGDAGTPGLPNRECEE